MFGFLKTTTDTNKVKMDAYKFDELPEQLKLQIVYVFRDLAGYIGVISAIEVNRFYSIARKEICEDLALPQLIDNSIVAEEDVINFFYREADVGKCLRIVEILFSSFVRFVTRDTHVHFDWADHFRSAIRKLNKRFQEHSVGYEFRDNKILRIDSSIMHKEVVAPAMIFLQEKYLKGANEEFMKAREHFRHIRYGECINECLKAFESTMKAICHRRGWQYKQTNTAKQLLSTCEQNKLFPSYMQSSLSGLRSVLENVATVRNKLSGHGQGAQTVQISEEIAAFIIHSTGANILLLASLEKS